MYITMCVCIVDIAYCLRGITILERSVKAMKIKLLDVEYKELSIIIWPLYSSLLVCTKVGLDE